MSSLYSTIFVKIVYHVAHFYWLTQKGTIISSSYLISISKLKKKEENKQDNDNVGFSI